MFKENSMNLILLMPLVLLAISLVDFFIKRKSNGKFFKHGFAIDILFPGFISGIILSFFLSLTAPTEEKLISVTSIINLKEVLVEKGSWFLGTGKSKATPYYEYNTKEKGGYKLERMDAINDVVTIIETKTEQPAIKVYKTFIAKDYRNWVFIFGGDDDTRAEFLVPEGTIKKGFSLN